MLIKHKGYSNINIYFFFYIEEEFDNGLWSQNIWKQ